MIQMDTGFFKVPMETVRRHAGAKPQLWEVKNRHSGVIDCLIGPCSFDDMVLTFATLEKEQPIAQMRVTYRGPYP